MTIYYHGFFLNKDDRRYDTRTLRVVSVVKILWIFEYTKPSNPPRGKLMPVRVYV